MHNKVILPLLLTIFTVGITQLAFGEEPATFVAVDMEEFEKPELRYDDQQVTITGFVDKYYRGDEVTITIIYPDETEEELNTYASKKGEIYTIFNINRESQVGTYMIFLEYDVDIVFTSFEIVENQ